MTYLEIINDVLERLREDTVSTWNETAYSKLIGKLVNDSKRQVEDSFNWNALATTVSINTAGGTSNYTLTGSGYKFKVESVHDLTNNAILTNQPIAWIRQEQNMASSVQLGQPSYYAFNGQSNGDTKVELYNTPSGVYNIAFNLYVPQADLAADATVLSVPSEPVIAGAYARALVERGEDGGLNSSEAYALFKAILADSIALEAGRFIENDVWVAV